MVSLFRLIFSFDNARPAETLQVPLPVISAGFEPATSSSASWRSIQLSYETVLPSMPKVAVFVYCGGGGILAVYDAGAHTRA